MRGSRPCSNGESSREALSSETKIPRGTPDEAKSTPGDRSCGRPGRSCRGVRRGERLGRAAEHQPALQIGGTIRVGQTLSVSTGAWTNGPTSYRYQWQRCDNTQGQNCASIAGANAVSYKLVGADRGKTIVALVRGCNADGCAPFANSAFVGPIAANAVPTATTAPTVTGRPVAGEPLTVNSTWTGAPDSYSYQWYQCDSAGAACVGVAGGTGAVYTARNEDVVGDPASTRRTRRAPARSTSGPSDLIAQPTGSTATVPVTSVSLPNQLVVGGIQFVPSVINSTAPFVARFKVTESKGRTVSGVLVYAIALPYGLIRPAGEVTTGADGIATITFTPTAKLPKSGAIQFFVRARKPGDNPLAGVSSRRLVQVKVRR